MKNFAYSPCIPWPGGTHGFDKHVWQVEDFKAADEGKETAQGKAIPEDVILKELTLSTTSEDGDQGRQRDSALGLSLIRYPTRRHPYPPS